MDNKINKINVTAAILEKIETDSIRMRPRWKFKLEKISLELSLFILSLLGIYVFSLMMYYWKINELKHYFGFGFRGMKEILQNFPYELFSVSVLLLAILVYLIKKMDWGYKKTWQIWAGMSLMIMFISSGGLLSAKAHEQLEQSRIVNDYPTVNKYYHERLRNISNNAFLGEISSIENDELAIIENKKIKDKIGSNQASSTKAHTLNPNKIKINSQKKKLEVGEEVKIMGKRMKDGKLDVWGIKVIKQKKEYKAKERK